MHITHDTSVVEIEGGLSSKLSWSTLGISGPAELGHKRSMPGQFFSTEMKVRIGVDSRQGKICEQSRTNLIRFLGMGAVQLIQILLGWGVVAPGN